MRTVINLPGARKVYTGPPAVAAAVPIAAGIAFVQWRVGLPVWFLLLTPVVMVGFPAAEVGLTALTRRGNRRATRLAPFGQRLNQIRALATYAYLAVAVLLWMQS